MTTMSNECQILAVDDTPASLKLLSDILQEAGYKVRSAINGKLALSAAIRSQPELILLDIRMPEMDGFEVCRRLKAQPETSNIPVIFVSAMSDTEEKVQGFKLGAVDFVTKPYQHEELLARVQTHLEVGRLRTCLEDLVEERTSKLRENEARLRTLVQAIPDLVWLKNVDGVYLGCNPMFERFFGAREEDILGKTDYDFVGKELADFFRANDRKALAAGKPSINEEWLTFAENGYRGLFETIKTPMQDRVGKPIGVLGIARDITERHNAEEQLRVAATAFEAQEGIVITDVDQVIIRVNQAFSDITGYTAEEAIGQTPRQLKSGRHNTAFYKTMWDRICQDGNWQGEIWDRRKNGEIFPEWLNITAVKNDQETITHYVGTMIDVTARKEADDKIHQLVFYDSLTQLPNRRLLIDRLQHTLAASDRHQNHAAVLFIDLDNFKTLNDTMGHNIGDLLLIEVAIRLQGCVREGDTVARLGGDEFVIFLEELSQDIQQAAAEAETVSNKILAAISQPYLLQGYPYHSSASIGVSLFQNQEISVDELLKRADTAMYQAKSAGRNTLRFYDPAMQAALEARTALEKDLRNALSESQFRLYYQMQVDHNGSIHGAEVLIRWQHPQLGLISPLQFIQLAEETGLILPIGQWVLDTACAQLKVWEADPLTRNLQLAVNVSARQFRQPDFVEQVLQVLRSHALAANRLKLELTESLVLDDVEDTITKMQALREAGVRFSMDDFGTGYSSLSYLSQLPLDQLKIDQSFVRNISKKSSDALIVQTIIGMANNMGMEVIAEGVETEEQRAFLEQHGCAFCQGYLFGRPVPVGEFEARLKKS